MSVPSSLIFLDECGFTGEDLADKDQPIFVVASHSMSEERSADLKSKFFGGVQLDELKHSTLQRREAHRTRVVACLSEVLAEDVVQIAVAHKPYCLVMKMVDWIVEPVLYRAGYEMYAEGAGRALANVVYFCLDAAGLLEVTTRTFQRALRTRAPEAIREFHELLDSEPLIDALGEVHDQFAVARRVLGDGWVADLPKGPLEISVTMALMVCYGWRRRGLEAFNVVHDRSSAMAKHRPIWDAILSKDAPPAVIASAGFEVPFPIGVGETRFEDSRSTVALQVADVLAGATARWTTWMARGSPLDDRYAAKLDELFFANKSVFLRAFASFMWPMPDVNRHEGPAPGTVKALDYLTAVIAKAEAPRSRNLSR
jgi:hypothetical protein